MNSLLQIIHMPPKLVSFCHAAVAPETSQSVYEAVLTKHYATKFSCLFLSKEHLGLILLALEDSVKDLIAWVGGREDGERFFPNFVSVLCTIPSSWFHGFLIWFSCPALQYL